MCGLERYADAIVGTLDVEHRKRTTIGVELAAKVGKASITSS
jgi:ATP-binding cassette subfamily G (WHITE) protein 2 (SNQ2)